MGLNLLGSFLCADPSINSSNFLAGNQRNTANDCQNFIVKGSNSSYAQTTWGVKLDSREQHRKKYAKP